MIDALRLAVGTLTIIPTGSVQVTPRVAGRAMALAPLAVLPLAAVAGLVAWAGWLVGLPGLLVGVLVVAVLAVGTQALHLDGLADVADGLGSGWDRERALAVMKRGDVGPMGVVALVLVLLGQVAAISAWPSGGRGALLLGLAVCVSRCAVPTVCQRGVPAARPGGLGAAMAGTVPSLVPPVAWVLAVLALGVASGQWQPALIAVLVPTLSVGFLMNHCVRRFGGMTGDVIGACVETAFTTLLIMVVIML